MEILDQNTGELPEVTLDAEMEALLSGEMPPLAEEPAAREEAAQEEAAPLYEDSETLEYAGGLDIRYPPEALPTRKKGVRAELVMGLIAILAAALLMVMVVLCLPYFGADEDPETALHHREEPITLTQPPQ